MNTLSNNKSFLSLTQQRLLAMRLAALGDKQCGRDLKMSLTGGLLVAAGLALGALLTNDVTSEDAPSLRSSVQFDAPVGTVGHAVVPEVVDVHHPVSSGVAVAGAPVVQSAGVRDVVSSVGVSRVRGVTRQASVSAVEESAHLGFSRGVAVRVVGGVAVPDGRDGFVETI